MQHTYRYHNLPTPPISPDLLPLKTSPGNPSIPSNGKRKNTSPILRPTSASTYPSVPAIAKRRHFTQSSRASWLVKMDSVVIPSETVPEALKACEQILKRAKELKKAEPVVTYWCCFSAAQTALKVPNRTKESTMFLMSLLDALEQMKSVLAGNEAVTNEAAGSAFVENFALRVFMSADNDDRAGIAGKATIRKFVVAGQFIEVLRCFESGLSDDMEQKLQYARWKAADLAKALREGRTPIPGPPVPEEEPSPFSTLPTGSPSTSIPQTLPSPPRGRGSFSSLHRPPALGTTNSSSPHQPTTIISPRPSPLHTPRANLPGLDASPREDLRTPARTHSQSSGVWSTVATPGIPDETGEPRFTFDPAQTALPTSSSSSSPPQPRSPPDDKKNVRFMGPDGAPLSPATTHLTVDSYDVPAAPPPSVTNTSPLVSRSPSSSNPSSNTRPRGDSSSSLRSNSTSNQQPQARQQQPPPPPPPSLVSNVPANPSGLGLINTSNHPIPPPPPSSVVTSVPLTRKQIEQTQKHAKWAISALEFDDVETARTELRKALAMLG